MDLPSPEACYASILPALLSGGPSYELDPSLVSSQTHAHHRFLAAEATDPASYLFISASTYPASGLRKLSEACERRDRVLEDERGEPEFHVESDGEVRSRVRLAHKLYCVLCFEMDEKEGARWKFLTLVEGDDGLAWKRSLGDAFASVNEPSAQSRWNQGGIDIPGSDSAKGKVEMAQGEGTTPGAYGAANDFWAGYSSDEDDVRHDQSRKMSMDNGVHHDGDGEDDYWASYGDAPPSVIGDTVESPAASGSMSRRRSSTVKTAQPLAAASAVASVTPVSATASGAGAATSALDQAMSGLWRMFVLQTKDGMTLAQSREAFIHSATTAAHE